MLTITDNLFKFAISRKKRKRPCLSAVFPIARDSDLTQNTMVNLKSAFARPKKTRFSTLKKTASYHYHTIKIAAIMSYQEENYGLLLHFHSHTDKRCKVSLLKTMLHRAYALSSTTVAFNTECDKLRSVSSRLDYPVGLINFTINNFIFHIVSENKALSNTNDSGTERISLSFKDQVAANAVRKQLRDLSHKIGVTVHPAWAKNWGKILNPKTSSHKL